MKIIRVNDRKTRKKFLDAAKVIYKNDNTWVADFNPKMRRLFIAVGSVPAKNYITYRYLFDRTKEFKRYPIPQVK